MESPLDREISSNKPTISVGSKRSGAQLTRTK